MRHQASFRGHRLAVYCLAIDCSGSFVVTGSDDWLVKVRGLHEVLRMEPVPAQSFATRATTSTD